MEHLGGSVGVVLTPKPDIPGGGERFGQGVFLKKSKHLRIKEEWLLLDSHRCTSPEGPFLEPAPVSEVAEVTAPGY